jgi:hypothetical protein
VRVPVERNGVMGTVPRGGGTDHRWLDALEHDLVSKGLGRSAAAAEECRAALPDIARMVLRLRRAQWRHLPQKIRGFRIRGSGGVVGPANQSATLENVRAECLAPSPRLPWLHLTDPVEMLLKLEADVVATRGAELALQALRAFCERLIAASPAPGSGRARQVTLWKAGSMAYALDQLRYGEGDWVRAGRKLKEHGWKFSPVTAKQLPRVLRTGCRRWWQQQKLIPAAPPTAKLSPAPHRAVRQLRAVKGARRAGR